ncbi:MAG: elongator complex protein 3 [Eggerthellaceae bacterium]
MERILLEILERLRTQETIDARELDRILNAENKRRGSKTRRFAKKRIVPYYLAVKEQDPARWESWRVTPELERRLLAVARMKPRRTASGVATITVITKPWRCASDCLYCPADIRMPKSYLADEPACQRAERNWFDPYLQVSSRLKALIQMGHITDKIELIVLGGTWCDYPAAYQIWFSRELFRALNEAGTPAAERSIRERRNSYRALGLPNDPEELAASAADLQAQVVEGSLTYNQAICQRYGDSDAWQTVAAKQEAAFEDLEAEQQRNEQAVHRMVGLVIETRPDTVTAERLTLIRRLGCTKVQMGVQSLDSAVLKENHRRISPDQIAHAFNLAHLFGFKIHAHFMVNLKGSTPEADKADYRRFVGEAAFQPDEIKLYPCALIAGSKLVACYRQGTWQPYPEVDLIDVLAEDTLATPPFIRISRMIRDFSAGDIVAGNKKGNLRQLVDRQIEARCLETGRKVQEIRSREIGLGTIDRNTLTLDCRTYDTAVTREHFLQWITPDNRIAGFLRLSFPDQRIVHDHADELPIGPGEAMIREVHVYGKVAGIGHEGTSAQHTGLGRALVEHACTMARNAGFTRINVISSVGTRSYYRHLGFTDRGLYQQRILT